MIKKIVSGIIVFLLIGCTSYDKIYRDSDISKAMLSGKIITEEGLPLEGVKIKLNDKQESRSDINGKFFFTYLFFGEYKLTFEKEGYSNEEYIFKYDMKNKKIPFIKAKLMSFNFLLNEGIYLLSQKKYSEVESVLERLKRIASDEESYLYLKSVYLCERKKYKDALDIVESLINSDRKNLYYNLLLIDIYGNLGWFQKKAELCLIIGKNNPDEYLYLIKQAAEIYKEKLEDQENYNKLIELYESMNSKK
ncbi:MAG TPA: hypothetical protein PK771_01875 [Spirochaetota bacterium]|nr:hypothetical protein [Spirochaetota bacterium]